jgi:hypothetical protein
MLADVLTAISLLRAIGDVYESMLGTYICGKRLLQRTLTFNEEVEKLKNDEKAATIKSDSVRQLVVLLEEIRDFGQKYAGWFEDNLQFLYELAFLPISKLEFYSRGVKK